MPLNIVSSNVDPYLKYNAKTGEWTVVKDADDVRTIVAPTFLADFQGIRPGWLRFREGQAPERALDPSLDVSGPPPGEGFKRGFVLDVYLREAGKLEFSSASLHTCKAVYEAYTRWEQEHLAHPGLCPVIRCVAVQAKPGKYGTNHRPQLTLAGWAKWPPNGNGGQPASAASRPSLVMPAAPEPPPPASADEYGAFDDDDLPF
jgi:hypothetical protein